MYTSLSVCIEISITNENNEQKPQRILISNWAAINPLRKPCNQRAGILHQARRGGCPRGSASLPQSAQWPNSMKARGVCINIISVRKNIHKYLPGLLAVRRISIKLEFSAYTQGNPIFTFFLLLLYKQGHQRSWKKLLCQLPKHRKEGRGKEGE